MKEKTGKKTTFFKAIFSFLPSINLPLTFKWFSFTLISSPLTPIYCQYARPNDKLPSVKRAFLRAKRERRGLQIHLPPDSDGCWDIKQLRLANENLRIQFQCQRWRKFVLAHFVVLYSWRFYFKMEDQLFPSQNSDLNNDLALCIDNNDNQMTIVAHKVCVSRSTICTLAPLGRKWCYSGLK